MRADFATNVLILIILLHYDSRLKIWPMVCLTLGLLGGNRNDCRPNHQYHANQKCNES